LPVTDRPNGHIVVVVDEIVVRDADVRKRRNGVPVTQCESEKGGIGTDRDRQEREGDVPYARGDIERENDGLIADAQHNRVVAG
jgi:hypothetical protein